MVTLNNSLKQIQMKKKKKELEKFDMYKKSSINTTLSFVSFPVLTYSHFRRHRISGIFLYVLNSLFFYCFWFFLIVFFFFFSFSYVVMKKLEKITTHRSILIFLRNINNKEWIFLYVQFIWILFISYSSQKPRKNTTFFYLFFIENQGIFSYSLLEFSQSFIYLLSSPQFGIVSEHHIPL